MQKVPLNNHMIKPQCVLIPSAIDFSIFNPKIKKNKNKNKNLLCKINTTKIMIYKLRT